MAKEKEFHFTIWSRDEVDVDVMAKNKAEAQQKLQDMMNNDRIRWDKSWTADSGIKYNGMTRKEI